MKKDDIKPKGVSMHAVNILKKWKLILVAGVMIFMLGFTFVMSM
jgi:hypothetical protein